MGMVIGALSNWNQTTCVLSLSPSTRRPKESLLPLLLLLVPEESESATLKIER